MAVQQTQEQQADQKKRSRPILWIVLAIILLVGLVVGGLFGWRAMGRRAYVEGLSAYSLLEVDTAAAKFTQVSRSPEFFGSYVADANVKLAELAGFQQAMDSWEGEEYADALLQCASFIEMYEVSPYLGACREAVNEIPFEWAQQAVEEGDYEGAVQIFDDVLAGEYPEIVKIEVRTNLPVILLGWGDYLVNQGEGEKAIEVYRECYSQTGNGEELAQAEDDIRKTYQALADEALGAKEFETADEVYDALANWLDKNGLNGADEAREQAAQALQAWGDQYFDEEDYENAIVQYEETLATGVDALATSTHDKLIDSYQQWGDQLFEAGSTGDAVEKFVYLIGHYGDELDQLDFSEAAIDDLLAYVDVAIAQDEYENANMILSAISQMDVTDEQQMVLYHRWGVSLFGTATHVGYLESLRKLAVAQKFSEELVNAEFLAFIEEVRGRVLETISGLDHGLGQLVLNAAEADKYDTKKFSVCKRIEGEEVCLDEDDYALVMNTLGVDEDVDLFIFLPEMPEEMRAKTPGQAQYFAVIENTTTWEDSCGYYEGSKVVARLERHRRTTTVTIYRLADGGGIGQTSFQGGDPPRCPQSRSFSSPTEYVYGSYPDSTKIFIWLSNYAVTGE